MWTSTGSISPQAGRDGPSSVCGREPRDLAVGRAFDKSAGRCAVSGSHQIASSHDARGSVPRPRAVRKTPGGHRVRRRRRRGEPRRWRWCRELVAPTRSGARRAPLPLREAPVVRPKQGRVPAAKLPSQIAKARAQDLALKGYERAAPAGHESRVAGAVTRPGSHRTVRTLVVYGSSGRRVVNPAAGRFSTSRSSP